MWIGFLEGSLVITVFFSKKKWNLNSAVETGLDGVFIFEKRVQIANWKKKASLVVSLSNEVK